MFATDLAPEKSWEIFWKSIFHGIKKKIRK